LTNPGHYSNARHYRSQEKSKQKFDNVNIYRSINSRNRESRVGLLLVRTAGSPSGRGNTMGASSKRSVEAELLLLTGLTPRESVVGSVLSRPAKATSRMLDGRFSKLVELSFPS
jgi:hypothetical protein